MNIKSSYSRCIIGAKYIDEIKELSAQGLECITLSASTCLENEINSHADILCCKVSDDLILAEETIAGELSRKINDYSVVPVSNIASPYPEDVKLNVAFFRERIVCNSKYIARELSDFCIKNKIEIINAKQGYTKCNLCIINDNAVITEDSGLAYLLKNYQFDVLKIEPGYVALSDNHYGFIGGASGKIGQDTIYFSGNLEEHPDYNKISKFLDKHYIKPIFNKNRKLTDFGGLIML